MLHFLHIFAAASACEWIRSCHVCECATVSILCSFFELLLTLTLSRRHMNLWVWVYKCVCVCIHVSVCELHYWKLVRFYAQKRLLGCCYVFNYPHFAFFCCCRLPAACFGSRFVAACCCCLPAAAACCCCCCFCCQCSYSFNWNYFTWHSHLRCRPTAAWATFFNAFDWPHLPLSV